MSLLLVKGINAGNSRLSGGFGASLLTGDNSTFDAGVGAWTPQGSAIASDGTFDFNGTNTLKITVNGTNTNLCRSAEMSTFVAATKYRFECMVYLDTGWDGGEVTCDAGSLDDDTPGTQVKTSTIGSWVKIYTDTVIGTDTSGRLVIRAASNPTNGLLLAIENAMIRPFA